jgi:hypothetical protein
MSKPIKESTIRFLHQTFPVRLLEQGPNNAAHSMTSTRKGRFECKLLSKEPSVPIESAKYFLKEYTKS